MRKLAWFAVFFAASALFLFSIPERFRTLLWPVPIVLLTVCGLSCIVRGGKRSLLRFLRIAWLGFGLGFLYTLIWNQMTLIELKPLVDTEQTVEAVILENSTEASFGLRTDIRVGHLRCTLFTDGKAPLEAGQRIRVRAAFRSTVERTNSDYYLTLGVPLFAYARESPEALGEAKAVWRFLPARIGAFLRERIQTIYDRNSSGFLLAVLTGDRSRLSRDTWFYSMLRASGAAHCVAVSGMHLSFLVMFLYVVLGRGRVSACICIPVTLLFMAMTGFSASVVRAGVMQIAVCGAKITRNQYDSLTALAAALLVLILLNPYSIRNAGLILSFSSTLGILLFYPDIRNGLPSHPNTWNKRSLGARIWNGIQASLGISFSSAVFTTPLIALFFRQISLFAPLTNLLILWAVSLCFCLGLLGVLVSLVSLPVGALFRFPVGLLVGYIREVVGRIGSFPAASLYIRSPYLPCWLGVTWICMALFRFLPGLTHRTQSFVITLVFGLVLFLGISWLEPALGAYRFCALDVGHGQCLVLTGRGSTTVIDCGGSLYTDAGDLAAEYLFAQGKFRLNHLILTHFHQDHVNGVPELLRRVPVETLYCPRPADGDMDAADLIAQALERGTRVVYLEQDILWFRQGELELALVPPLNQVKENESGICIAANAGALSVLCTGDAGKGTEQRLLERLRIENLAVLVAGHHGSAYSVSEALLESVNPAAVVISVGRNSYGLPSPETVDRIREHGITVFRTDEQGDILFLDQQGSAIWEN